jgi:hypothetical protein
LTRWCKDGDIARSTQLRTNKQNARRLANNYGLSKGTLNRFDPAK